MQSEIAFRQGQHAGRKQKLPEDVCLRVEMASEQSSAADMAVLEPLLQRRDRIKAITTWPLDEAIWQRLFFYVPIPPLAWSCAAIVELVIDVESVAIPLARLCVERVDNAEQFLFLKFQMYLYRFDALFTVAISQVPLHISQQINEAQSHI